MSFKTKPKNRLVGYRYGLFIAGFLGLLGATLYPIAIYPMINPDYYKNVQSQTRKGVKQEDIQPGNMKVWSDPFDRRKSDE